MSKAAWERQRLKEFYSKISDGELAEIALNWADLTDIARAEIRDEAERRGLDIKESLPVADAAGSPENSGDSLSEPVTVGVFDTLGEAVIVKGLLESSGIVCSLVDGFRNRVTAEITSSLGIPAIGGIQLQVKAEDVEAAKEFLDQPVPGLQEAEEDD